MVGGARRWLGWTTLVAFAWSVRTASAAETAPQGEQESSWLLAHLTPDWLLTYSTIALMLFTALLWRATRQAVIGGERAVEAAVAAAGAAKDQAVALTKTAATMEALAKASQASSETTIAMAATQRDFWQRQLRAYLAVEVGGAVYQVGEKNLRFEVKPVLVNTGHTPAYRVAVSARAEVISIPVTDSFNFYVPDPIEGTGSVVGQGQQRGLSAILDYFVDEQEVEAIKRGRPRALCAWGTVRYVDVFDVPHEVRFCHTVYWLPDGSVRGHYAPHGNHSD